MRTIIHAVLLSMESALFAGALFYPLYHRVCDEFVPQGQVWTAFAVWSMGCGLVLGATMVLLMLKKRIAGYGLLAIGFCSCVFGIWLSARFATPVVRWNFLSPDNRLERLGGVVVSFDAGCDGIVLESRVLARGKSYADNVNVFPSESSFNFYDLRNITLSDNVFSVAFIDPSHEDRFANYFSKDVVPAEALSGMCTYVVEVLERTGSIKSWCIGETLGPGASGKSRLPKAFVSRTIGAGSIQCVGLACAYTGTCDRLDRAFVSVSAGEKLQMRFRVALFAGKCINQDNYHYVAPGSTLSCMLPVPNRDGYAFEGWYDGDRRITEESKVEKRETHTLKARWRKL